MLLTKFKLDVYCAKKQVAESFGHCLGGIMSTVAQGVQLEIVTKGSVTIKDVETERPMEASAERLVIDQY